MRFIYAVRAFQLVQTSPSQNSFSRIHSNWSSTSVVLLCASNRLFLMKKKFAFCLTLCLFGLLNQSFGQPKNDNSVVVVDGSTVYETPKVFELMNIAFALTDTSKAYFSTIDTTTQYYKEVIRHFATFRSHKLVRALTEQVKKNASTYAFNLTTGSDLLLVNGKLARANRFPPERKIWNDLHSVHQKSIEDFSRLSGFEQFYVAHQEYYAKMLQQSKEYARVAAMQQWLEKEFPIKYDKIATFISPLMRGSHWGVHFTHKGENVSLMYVSAANGYNNGKRTKQQISGIYTGISFTEIDHFYVNPISDRFEKELNQLMGGENRNNWTKPTYGSNLYDNGYKVFNEYMTHGVYLLYTNAKYAKEDQEVIKKHRIRLMSELRKYHRFEDFYTQLEKLYLSKPSNKTLADLYPDIIEWCKRQNLQPIKS